MTDFVSIRPHDAWVHHPWRWIRERLPEWQVLFEPLPGSTSGSTDLVAATIRIDSSLTQAQRRSTIEHERIHARDRDSGPQPAWREDEVNREAAVNLIPFHRLLDACLWAYDEHEAADELWVDLDTLRCRIDNLTKAERQVIRRAQRQRDFHEEGRTDGISED